MVVVLISIIPPCSTLPPSTQQFTLHLLLNHWKTELRTQHVQHHSLKAQVTFHCNLCGRRDEVTIATGYLRWGQGDPEALLLPLSQLDPESRGQERVRSHSLRGRPSMPFKEQLAQLKNGPLNVTIKCYYVPVCVHRNSC